MEPKHHKSGKKNRKHGRWSRAPSMRVYKATGRGALNKQRKMEKHRRAMLKASRKRLLRAQQAS